MRNLLVVAALFSSACSVITGGPGDLRCEDGAACPIGMTCSEGVCRACEDAVEICNGVDDNCNGEIDEGFAGNTETCNGIDEDCDGRFDEGNDLNGDGVIRDTIDVEETFDVDGDFYNDCGTQDCGTTPDAVCVPNLELADCEPRNADVNPGIMREECDVIDHDCDGNAAPPPGENPCDGGRTCINLQCVEPWDCTVESQRCTVEGEICDTTTTPFRCVNVGCTDEECVGASFCNPVTGECEVSRGAGEACGRDIECASQVCSPMERFGFAPVPPGGICAQACCSDNDCPSDQFCWASGSGGRTCLPASTQSAVTGRTTLGAGAAYAACSSGAECRSGRCDSTLGRCIHACRRSGDCPGGMTCVQRLLAGVVNAYCAPALGEQNDSCGGDLDCSVADCQSLCGFGDNCCISGSCATHGDCNFSSIFNFDSCKLYVYGGTELIPGCGPTSDGEPNPCCIPSHCGAGETCRAGNASLSGETFFPMVCTPDG